MKDKKDRAISKFAVLICQVPNALNNTIISVSLGVIAIQFADATSTQISLIYSLPFLFTILGVLLFNVIKYYIKPKILLIISIFLVSTSGICLVFANNIYTLLALRAVTGFGIGILIVLAAALIPVLYPTQVGKLNGLQYAIASVHIIIFSLTSGIVAAMNWKYAIYLFAYGYVVMLIIALFLPSVELPIREADKQKKERVPFGLKFWGFVIFIFFVMVLNNVAPIALAQYIMFVMNQSASYIGIVSIFMAVGIVCGGLIFAWLYQKQEKISFLAGALLSCIGFWGAGNSMSILTLSIWMFLIGLGSLGMIMPWFMSAIPKLVPPSAIYTAMSIVSLATFFGSFCAAYYISAIEVIVKNMPLTTASFLTTAVFFTGITIVALARMFIGVKKPSEII